MSQKNSFRILAAAVILGFGATTAAPAVMAAPVSIQTAAAEAEALPPGVSIGSTISRYIGSASTPGYGDDYAEYDLAGGPWLSDDFTLTSSLDTVYHRYNGLYANRSFAVKLTDQPQTITYLVAKHRDNLVGGDVKIQLETPLVVPAFKPWPAPQYDDRLTMPEMIMGKDAKGFQTFSFTTMNDARTTSTDLEVSGPGDRLDIHDAATGDFLGQILPGSPEICDSADSIYAGKELSIRSSYRLKSDLTERYGEVRVSCDAYVPLSLKLSQEKADAKPGDLLEVGIDAQGTYGHGPVIVWSVDGKEIDHDGSSFDAPAAFSTIKATVTVRNREGNEITKFVGWGQATEKPKPVEPTTPEVKPDPKPADPDTKPDTKPEVKPDPKPDTKDPKLDVDGEDDVDPPIKQECEGLCDGANEDDGKPKPPSKKPLGPVITEWIKGVQPSTGVTPIHQPQLVKPRTQTPTPGVMDTLSAEALAKLS